MRTIVQCALRIGAVLVLVLLTLGHGATVSADTCASASVCIDPVVCESGQFGTVCIIRTGGSCGSGGCECDTDTSCF